jgi:diaminopimelate epimerase
MTVSFFKYQGTGNDFVIIDNRSKNISLKKKQIKSICDRKFGIGADGLMLLENEDGFDFKMVYFNADGNESSMCGNGGRCLVKFASFNGILKSVYHFIATDGEHDAEIEENGNVRLKMKDVDSVDINATRAILNTGSPHYVKFTRDVKKVNVFEEGRDIRYSKEFSAEGINVNFAESTDDDAIIVRTYERGVENETLSCGTGVTASALAFAHNDRGFNRVEVNTPGGDLYVEFEKMDDTHFTNIWLCGPAEFVFKGEIEI